MNIELEPRLTPQTLPPRPRGKKIKITNDIKMVSSPSNLKTPHPLQALSMKSSSSSTLSYMKIKTLIHSFIFSHVCRVIRALSKAKSIIVEVLKDNQPIHHFIYPKKNKNKKYMTKILFGSFRLHYNWCSSHVMPVPAPVLDEFTATHLYYDPSWNSIISTEKCEDHGPESELSGYLQWLEEKGNNANEIDRLADVFIANCHEKFRLEKQESYRRFQEMLARSMWGTNICVGCYYYYYYYFRCFPILCHVRYFGGVRKE